MFTGIIEEIGILQEVQPADQAVGLVVRARRVLEDLKIGDSVAVSGVCLTAVDLASDRFRVEVVAETLRRTTLGTALPGAGLNLERALTLQTRLGGHVVTGHVDAVGTVEDVSFEGDSMVIEVGAPGPLQKYIAEKGSVAIDGVSLTVMNVTAGGFRVALIPHTRKETTLGHLVVGSRVNLEVDVVARYVERLLRGGPEGQ